MIRAGAPSSAGSPGPGGYAAAALRFDQINSRELLGAARRVYFAYLASWACTGEPAGVVIQGDMGQGHVVFELPVLLPAERFVPIELLRPRGGASRGRSNRQPPSRGLS